MQARDQSISIRKAEIRDVHDIANCLQEVFATVRSLYTPAAFHDTVLTPEGVANRMASMCVFVAVSPEGEIVGTIAGNLIGSGEGHVRGMAVRPAWHGREVADKLLQEVESEFRILGCARISVDTTLPLQRAMRFYEKHGFRRSGRISDFFGMELLEYVKALDT